MSAATALQRRVIEPGDGGSHDKRWALIGELGAMEFHVMPPSGAFRYDSFGGWMPMGIEKHSAKQLHHFAPNPTHGCHLLEGPCWPDGTSSGGHALAERAWRGDHWDEAVIWAELEDWYSEWRKRA